MEEIDLTNSDDSQVLLSLSGGLLEDNNDDYNGGDTQYNGIINVDTESEVIVGKMS